MTNVIVCTIFYTQLPCTAPKFSIRRHEILPARHTGITQKKNDCISRKFMYIAPLNL